MTRNDDLYALPPDLPVPVDDGACVHLVGVQVPPVALPSTAGGSVRLDERSRSRDRRVVVYAYPRTGRRDAYRELQSAGVDVFGLSTQASDEQREAANRLHLPFELLSDANLAFARGLRLPTFEVEGRVLLKRVTLVLGAGAVERVFYPVFPPDKNAADLLRWLASTPRPAS